MANGFKKDEKLTAKILLAVRPETAEWLKDNQYRPSVLCRTLLEAYVRKQGGPA